MLMMKQKHYLKRIHENLQQLFIVSDFEVAGSFAEAPEHAIKLNMQQLLLQKQKVKHVNVVGLSLKVGEVKEHPTLCKRCAEVVKENFSSLA